MKKKFSPAKARAARRFNESLFLSAEQIAAHNKELDSVIGVLEARKEKPLEVYTIRRAEYNRLWQQYSFEVWLEKLSTTQHKSLRELGIAVTDDWRVIQKFGFSGGKPTANKGGAHLHKPRKGRKGRGRGARIVSHKGILEGYTLGTDNKPYKIRKS